jgi:hypothetical protein
MDDKAIKFDGFTSRIDLNFYGSQTPKLAAVGKFIGSESSSIAIPNRI